MKGEKTIITVRKDRETGFWSYRTERIVDGCYKGLVSWGSSILTSYSEFRKAMDIFLPRLKDMEKGGNSWFLTVEGAWA